MPDDLPGAHTPRVHRHDLVVEAGEAALVLGDQLRGEAGLALTRHLDRQLAGIGHHGLPAVAVTCVAYAVIAGEVMVHLGIQGTLGQRLLQGIQQAALFKGSAGRAASQQQQQPTVERQAKAFVRTLKRGYVSVNSKPEARTVIEQLPGWFAPYNDVHPHPALRYPSPCEFIAQTREALAGL